MLLLADMEGNKRKHNTGKWSESRIEDLQYLYNT